MNTSLVQVGLGDYFWDQIESGNQRLDSSGGGASTDLLSTSFLREEGSVTGDGDD
jgi:hypothetical protein